MNPGTLFTDRRWRWAAWGVVALLLLALPFITEAVLGRSWVRIIAVSLLFVMLALGLNIVVGFAGLLDLGYIAFFAVGAYSYALLASPQFAVHWPFLLLLPLGAFLATPVGHLPPDWIVGFLAFGLMALLYLVTEELLVEAHEKPDTPLISAMFFVGFLGLLLIEEAL